MGSPQDRGEAGIRSLLARGQRWPPGAPRAVWVPRLFTFTPVFEDFFFFWS